MTEFSNSGNGNELEKCVPPIESKGCATHFGSGTSDPVNKLQTPPQLETLKQQFVMFSLASLTASRPWRKQISAHTFFTPCRMSFFPAHKNDGWFTVSRDHSLPQWRNFSSRRRRPQQAVRTRTLLHCYFAWATHAHFAAFARNKEQQQKQFKDSAQLITFSGFVRSFLRRLRSYFFKNSWPGQVARQFVRKARRPECVFFCGNLQ